MQEIIINFFTPVDNIRINNIFCMFIEDNIIYEFKITKILGSGTTSTVYLIENTTNNNILFSMKVAKKSCEDEILNEAHNMIYYNIKYNIKNNYVPLYYGTIIENNNTVVIYPFVGYYNLDQFKKKNIFTFEYNIIIIKQLITQLINNTNNQGGIIHSDFKSSNIVFNIYENDVQTTIIDYGLMKDSNNVKNLLSTYYIISPESLLTMSKYNYLLDSSENIIYYKHDYFGLFSIILELLFKTTYWKIMKKYLFDDINVKFDELEYNEEYIYCTNVYVYMWYKFNYDNKNNIKSKSLYNLINNIEKEHPNFLTYNFINFDKFFDKYIIPNIDKSNNIENNKLELLKPFLFKLIQFEPSSRPDLNNIINDDFLN